MKAPRVESDVQRAARWPPARLTDAVVPAVPLRADDPDRERRVVRDEDEQQPPDEPGYGHGV